MMPNDHRPQERSLSHNAETERSLLGGLLLAPGQLPDVQAIVRGIDFARPAHRALFEMLCQLHREAGGFDIVTITDEMDKRGNAETMGGIGYVLDLTSACPSVVNIQLHAERVRDHADRRRMQLLAERTIERVRDGAMSTSEIRDTAEAEILALSQSAQVQDWADMGEVVAEESRVLDERARNPGALTGLTTGFRELDRMLTGWQPTDLVVLAARPAMGKTALALNCAAAAARAGVGVGVFSMEMSKGQLVRRMLCADGRINAGHVRTGEMSPDEHRALHHAADRVHRWPVYIDDSCGLTIGAIRAKARRLKVRDPRLGLIVVDYLQLMAGEGGGRENRETAISTISRGLKVLARELEVPVLALSQLNRQVESRADKRPMMSDLRESGAIEQDADVILFIYRDEVYNPETPDKGLAEVNIAKQRAGETGTVRLAFQGHHNLFADLAGPSDRWEGYQ
jgi:replicative DNA helicase